MSLPSALTRRKSSFTVEGERVRLRSPIASDYAAWAALRAESRAHLIPWEPTWAADELTRDSFRRRLIRYRQAEREGSGYMFFIFAEPAVKLVGGIQLSSIRQGAAQSAATMGYWMGARYAGQGYMSDAVTSVLRHGLERLGFHRIEAACLPTNAASRRVLAKTGFTAEGTARKYLRINGEWQDHLLFAIVAGDPMPKPRYRDNNV
jgi:ribosomal-protein-alanine N-acetyltransferase